LFVALQINVCLTYLCQFRFKKSGDGELLKPKGSAAPAEAAQLYSGG
jgi:hypothetical protein